ncbi:MAG: aminoacyl-tRNA hydrolase [Bacillota bacterium]
MKLVVGLGNPGVRYETSRHNVGFMVADLIGDQLGIHFKKSRHHALLGETSFKGGKLLVAKPLTYMNLSGNAVLSLKNWYKLNPEEIIIIYDDMDLEVGRIRIRNQGSAGGQKGMASIIQALGTEKLTRVKIGIGRPPEGWESADHVLSIFSDEDWQVMQKVLPSAAEAVLELIQNSLEKVMNKYNN